MKWTLVRYKAKPGQADENQRLSAAVFSELQQKAPAGLRYAVFRVNNVVAGLKINDVSRKGLSRSL